MRPLSVVAAVRMARYLGRRIDSKLAYHSKHCDKLKKYHYCKHDKHRRILNGYAHLLGEAGVLEAMALEALEAVST